MKGAVLFSGLSLLASTLILLMLSEVVKDPHFRYLFGNNLFSLMIIAFSPLTAFLGMRGSVPSFSEIFREGISLILITALAYFLIGALLGWLYGKLKNRNKPPVNRNLS